MPPPFPRMDPLSSRLLTALEHLRALFTLPLAWARNLSDRREVIDADVEQWLEVLGANDGVRGLHSLLYAFGEFRALYYHRLAGGNATGALAAKVLARIWKPTESLTITTAEIGPGLFVAHGQATCIAAERIGRNCYVHHGVTIGWDYRGERAPVLGDGVFVGTGAAILGEVTIGDGARIGANAVVLCDVPAGATAVGSPARVVATPSPSALHPTAERTVEEAGVSGRGGGRAAR
ncbi:MAG TPA: hypothetical protein VFN50_08045 [Acidimicrobiales bacterium]|nr:hypothetical protein [Acidimicrobiales bacterium]